MISVEEGIPQAYEEHRFGKSADDIDNMQGLEDINIKMDDNPPGVDMYVKPLSQIHYAKNSV